MLFNWDKVIYFDDSLLDTFIHARPYINKYSYQGVVGVPTSYVGKPVTWKNHEPYGEPSMCIKELKILISEGWGIASHAKTHRQLVNLSREEVIEEVVGSYKWIKENLGVEPCCFIPPYNELNIFILTEAQKIYPYVRIITPELRDRTFHSLSKHSTEKDRMIKTIENLENT